MTFLASSLFARKKTLLLSFEQSIEQNAIESGVAPLVAALNVPGQCKSIASCEGHRGIFFFEEPPYVMFHAAEHLARRMAIAIEPEYGNCKLNFSWRVSAWFSPQNAELVWCIKLTSTDLASTWRRAKIDQDLQHLAGVVSGVILGFNPT